MTRYTITKKGVPVDTKYEELLAKVDYALQPIVNIHSGRVYAFEALIRNYESEYFPTIDSVFDTAFREHMLFRLDMRLREIAIKKFAQCTCCQEVQLFYNIDNRITSMPDFMPGQTIKILEKYGLSTSRICFELSEKNQLGAIAGVENLILNMYKQQGYKIAIDDFGVGFSGFQLLYKSEAHFIKIDRFFIEDIDKHKKKQLFVGAIIEIAQAMGIFVIAEGVETAGEFDECKRLGCNFVQGYFIQRPTRVLDELQIEYPMISGLSDQEKRAENKVNSIKKYLEPIACIKEDAKVNDLFDYFRENIDLTLVPIVGDDMSPLGIIKEVDIKEYIYSYYGVSLLQNQSKYNLKRFVTKCGVVDVYDSIEKILKIYSYNSNHGGILVTENKKYLGYLSAKVILNIINEKNLIDAKDQNPLSGLPGNKSVEKYISTCIGDTTKSVMVYFDFDNFKPFNDYYGFRNGDRVISLFANILKKHIISKDCLIGHIGGDDFFVGFRDYPQSDATVFELVQKLVEQFSYEVESFYNEEDRQRGYIIAKGRNDTEGCFALMSVSAAVCIKQKNIRTHEELVAKELSALKKTAKKMPNHIAWGNLQK